MSIINQTAALLTLVQVIQAGIKRHFRAARFGAPLLRGSGIEAGFNVTALGLEYRVTVTYLDADVTHVQR